MKNIKRIIAFALTFALMTTVLCFTAFAANETEDKYAEERAAIDAKCFTSGSRGSAESTGIIGASDKGYSIDDYDKLDNSVTWKLKDSVLIIDGNGYMAGGDMSYIRYTEPFAKNEHIKTIIIGPDVKMTRSCLFNTLPNLETIIIANNNSVGNTSYAVNSPKLKTIIVGSDTTDTSFIADKNTMDSALTHLSTTQRANSFNRVDTTYNDVDTVIAISSLYGNIDTLAAQAKAALADAHMTDEAWAMLPKALGGTEIYVDYTDKYNLTVSDWAKETVSSAFAAHIMPVLSSLPNDYTKPITRGEFCELSNALYEHFNNGYASVSIALEDVPYGHPHRNAISKAYDRNIITGYGKSKDGAVIFGPDDLLTREQAAVILNNMATALGKPMTAGNPPFTDSPADWAKTAVLNCYGSGVMLGTSDTTFSPKANYTIEQSIVTMYRLMEYAAK